MPNPPSSTAARVLVSGRVRPALSDKLKAEAKRQGMTESRLLEAILEEYFDGTIHESLRENLAEIREQFRELNDHLTVEAQPHADVDFSPIPQLADRIEALQKLFEQLAAANWHAVGVLLDQTNPTVAQRTETLAAFDKLLAQFRGEHL